MAVLSMENTIMAYTKILSVQFYLYYRELIIFASKKYVSI